MKIWWLLIHVVSLELVTCLRNAYTSVESIKKILELDKEVDSLLRSHLVHLDDHKDLILQLSHFKIIFIIVCSHQHFTK